MGTLPIRAGGGPNAVALTAADAGSVDGTYAQVAEGDVIENIRTRIAEVETALKATGLLA